MTFQALLVLIAIAALLMLWCIPKFQLRSVKLALQDGRISLSDILKAKNDRRVAIAQILGGLAVLATLYYSNRTAELSEHSQLTDRISKTVEQLGSDNLSIQLGGVHQLDRIAVNNDTERMPLLQILASSLEQTAKLSEPLQATSCSPSVIVPLRNCRYQ